MFQKYKKLQALSALTNKYVPQRIYLQKWNHSPHCYGCAQASPVLTCFWVCVQIQSLKGKTLCGSAKKNFLKGTIMPVKNKHVSLRITISCTAIVRPGPIRLCKSRLTQILDIHSTLMLLLLRILCLINFFSLCGTPTEGCPILPQTDSFVLQLKFRSYSAWLLLNYKPQRPELLSFYLIYLTKCLHWKEESPIKEGRQRWTIWDLWVT